MNVPLKGSNAWNKLPVPTIVGKCDYLAGLVLTLGNCTYVSRRIRHIQQSTIVCVAGKRYNLADVSAALSMSLGLIWFTLADSKVAPNFNVTGISFSNSWLLRIWRVEHCVLLKKTDLGWSSACVCVCVAFRCPPHLSGSVCWCCHWERTGKSHETS